MTRIGSTRPGPGILALVVILTGLVAAIPVSTGRPADAPPAEAGPAGWFGKAKPMQKPPFVEEFAGIDQSSLPPAARERFIQRANTEYCTCGQSGCARHTLAFCHKVDPGCPRAEAMLKSLVAALQPPRQENGSPPSPAPASPSAPAPAPARPPTPSPPSR